MVVEDVVLDPLWLKNLIIICFLANLWVLVETSFRPLDLLLPGYRKERNCLPLFLAGRSVCLQTWSGDAAHLIWTFPQGMVNSGPVSYLTVMEWRMQLT